MNGVGLRVSALYVYPIKSLGGISLSAMAFDEMGPRFDRRWMLVDDDGRFISQREEPRMALISTQIDGRGVIVSTAGRESMRIEPVGPDAERVQVSVWSDTIDALRAGDAADRWFSAALTVSCRLVCFANDVVRLAERGLDPAEQPIGFADGYPLLVVGAQSLRELNGRIVARGRSALPMNRFRPNVVIDGAAAWDEDVWKRIAIGDDDMHLSIVKPCARCSITTVDQVTGERGKEPLATLATYRRSSDGSVMMGQNALHDRTGTIRVGDEVRMVAASS
jgi:uncharacterized protein YcbX